MPLDLNKECAKESVTRGKEAAHHLHHQLQVIVGGGEERPIHVCQHRMDDTKHMVLDTRLSPVTSIQ